MPTTYRDFTLVAPLEVELWGSKFCPMHLNWIGAARLNLRLHLVHEGNLDAVSFEKSGLAEN